MQVNDQTALAIIKGSSKGAEKVELKLDKPIPKEIMGKVIRAKITDIKKDGSVKLTMPNGKVITGKLAEPLPKGSEIMFTTNAEGEVKVIKLKIPENKQELPQQKGSKNNKNDTSNNQNKTGKETLKQTSKQQNKNQQITEKPVKIQTVGNKPLSMNLGPRFNVTVTSNQPNSNGFQQVILPDVAKTKLNIKLPQTVPVGTKLTIKILAHDEAKVLNVKEPKANERLFTTNTQEKLVSKTVKFETKDPALNNVGSKLQVTVNSPIQNKKGFFKATLANNEKVTISLKLPQDTKEGTRLSIKILPKNEALITKEEPPITGRNLLANKVLKKPQQLALQQQSKEPSVTFNKNELPPIKVKFAENLVFPKDMDTSSAQKANSTSTVIANSTLLDKIKIIVPQSAKLDLITKSIKLLTEPTGSNGKQGGETIKIPLNTPIAGKVSEFSGTSSNTNKPNYILKLPQGLRLDVNSQLPIAKGATMGIRFTPNGIAEVVRIVEPLPINSQNNQEGYKQPDLQSLSQQKVNYKPAEKILNLPIGSKFTAIVSSKSEGGIQTLAMPNGQKFQTHSTKPLPIGAEVTVKISSNGEAEITQLNMPSANLKAEALLDFSRRWGELQKAFNLLKQTHPETLDKIKKQLPNPETKAMLPSLLQFAEAVSNHNKTKFLGDETLNLLKSLGVDFTSDLQQLHHLQQKPDNPDGWRSFFFPFINGENSDQAGFYWRNQEKDNNNEKNTRFVVNLSMSELGAVQIDGLMQDKHMMLKIRLHKLPSEDFAEEINNVVQKILEPIEIKGTISVEISDTFETDPLHDILQQENHTGLVV